MSIVGSEQWMYQSAAGFYDFPIGQSLRFEDGDSAYLSRTPASAGNRKTWTFSAWLKRGNLGSTQMILAGGSSDTDRTIIRFGSSDNIEIDDYTGSYNFRYITNAVFRDVSAFYNITVVADISNATTTERVRLYVNGERITSFSTESTPLSGINTRINNNVPQQLGKHASGSNQYYDGYMAEINFVDNQALNPTSFGELKSGIWIPKDTADLTFGTNGFRLQFGDTTDANGFNAVTYTGNQTNGHAISGVGFSSSPDFVWIKERSSTSSHLLVDSVRGASKGLASNATSVEENLSSGEFSSFDSDGFTVDNNNRSNQSGQTYIAWAWDAGSGSAASNTDGDITSTVKANTDYGFSITSYTGNGSAGATVGHSLGVQPDMIIVKSRDNARDWRVYHSSLGATKAIQLNKTDAANTSSAFWNNTEPTSSVFSIGNVTTVNGSGEDYIAYCFAEKTGYSKFGTYSGTGAAGNSITGLGFKPAFLLAKRTDSTGNWGMWDNTRDTEGTITKYLIADLSNAEGNASSVGVDFDDDGFTFQGGSAVGNGSGGTYVYMAFADTRNAAFWKDTSGQGNDWQPNNLVFSDVVPDGTNNFAVLRNMGTPPASGAGLQEGNLHYTTGSSGSGRNLNRQAISTILPASGKWYAECRVQSSTNQFIGVGTYQVEISPTANNTRYSYIRPLAADVYTRTGSSENITSNYGSAGAVGDVFGVYLDLDASTPEVYYSKNGSWGDGSGNFDEATPTTAIALGDSFLTTDNGGNQGVGFIFSSAASGTSVEGIWNFGQDSTFAGNEASGGNTDANGLGDFFSTVPSGALSLCSANLPTGAIDTLANETPQDYFNTVLYTGDGNTGRTVTGVGFQPDFAWIKERSSTSGHILSNAIAGATKLLSSNTTDAEATDSNKITSFDSDGYTLGSSGAVNQSSQTYVGWNWKANGSGVSNTDGSITSTVSVGATSQQNWFSVVSWTGTGANATVGHGLNGATPELILLKNRNDSTNWTAGCTHYPNGWQNYQRLNDTSAVLTASSVWNNTAPATSVFSVGTSNGVNGSGDGIIAYCFASAEGLCRVGSYVGNGNTGDGTFVYTGFRPSFLLIKRTDAVDNWPIEDNKRNPSNLNRNYLLADTNGAEGTVDLRDFLSNGFKMRGSAQNVSGGNYIYLAIAEQPFKFANAR
jgi:hypothetical protein